MIRSVIQGAWSVMVLAVVGYFVLFVPLGERTLFEHVRRILTTDEAKELGSEIGTASRRLGDELRERLRGGPDAGVPGAAE